MFSKKEIDKYRKPFYDIKNYRYLSASEIKKARKNLTELKKVCGLKSCMTMLIVLIMIILIVKMMMIMLMMMNTKELEILEDYSLKITRNQ